MFGLDSVKLLKVGRKSRNITQVRVVIYYSRKGHTYSVVKMLIKVLLKKKKLLE